MNEADIASQNADVRAFLMVCGVGFLVAFVLAAYIGAVANAAEPALSPHPFLSFLNDPGPDRPLLDPPRLLMGVGAELRPAVVDTGSTGVAISATSIPRADSLRSLGDGRLTYSSSGRIMVGRWLVTPLTLAGRTGRVVTESIPVLAVDRIECTATARHCTPNEHPTGVSMLGIGFGREYDHQAQSTPDRNPLLHMAGSGSRSYVITTHGIGLGVGHKGFTLVRLVRDAAHDDWTQAPVCIVVNRGETSCGSLLVDTGVTGMFLTAPADHLPPIPVGVETLPDGTTIGVDLTPTVEQASRIGYSVTIGDRNVATTPSKVTLSGIGRRPAFLNTGVRFLNRFDYLYDADTGVVGFRAAP